MIILVYLLIFASITLGVVCTAAMLVSEWTHRKNRKIAKRAMAENDIDVLINIPMDDIDITELLKRRELMSELLKRNRTAKVREGWGGF